VAVAAQDESAVQSRVGDGLNASCPVFPSTKFAVVCEGLGPAVGYGVAAMEMRKGSALSINPAPMIQARRSREGGRMSRARQ
jgi:hypothetical protein